MDFLVGEEDGREDIAVGVVLLIEVKIIHLGKGGEERFDSWLICMTSSMVTIIIVIGKEYFQIHSFDQSLTYCILVARTRQLHCQFSPTH